VGDLLGMPDPRFEELSRPTAIYRIIFELNPFKFKFELGVHKLHFKKIEGKYLEVPCPRTHHKLGVPTHLAHTAGTVI
jgi:hypothetical protein